MSEAQGLNRDDAVGDIGANDVNYQAAPGGLGAPREEPFRHGQDAHRPVQPLHGRQLDHYRDGEVA